MQLKAVSIGASTIDVEALSVVPGREQSFTDESSLSAGPVARLFEPQNENELAEILRYCRANRFRISVAGGRTGIVGGAAAIDADVVVELDRIGGIEFRQEGEAATVVVGAGVRLLDLNEFLRFNHPSFCFPVNPTECWASIGGMVSTNASGSRSFYFGSVRNWVVGLRVILIDGSILNISRDMSPREMATDRTIEVTDGSGSRAVTLPFIPKPPTKNTIGYSFSENSESVDLFVGAEGTLGVISQVTLKLARTPEQVLNFVQFFESDASSLVAVERFQRMNRRILSLEFMCGRSLQLFCSSAKGVNSKLRPLAERGRAALHLEVDTANQPIDELVEELLEAVITAGGDPEESFAGIDSEVGNEVRSFRHAIPEAVNAINARRAAANPGLHKLATDMAVPRGSLEDIYDFYRTTLDRENLEFVIFGHAGDNHLHVNIMARDLQELERGKLLYRDFACKVVELGGAVSAEHGIGRIKRDFLAIQYSSDVISEMKKIKRLFDPENLLNRGVLFYD
jgi:D-lactate dehydrogenase (cytochrome)